MKKIVIALAVFVILIFSIASCSSNVIVKNNDDNLTSNLLSASELSSILADDNVNVENADLYNVCVLIELKESSPDNELVFSASNVSASDDIDAALKAHRDMVKDHYMEYNETNAKILGLENCEYYVSYYSPFIEVVFDDVNDYSFFEATLIDSIICYDVVSAISSCVVYEELSGEATIDTSGDTTDYLLNQAFEDIGVSGSSFTGEGVVVGVLDEGIPDNTESLNPGNYVMVNGDASGHTTVVAFIIGGTSGIAKDVFFVFFTRGNSIVDKCNIMISTYNVNIINMSMGGSARGNYTAYSACVDNIVSYTGCTFVKSSGNEGKNDKYITTPGQAMNAITVGSINYNKTISSTSSWLVSESFLLKPDLVAPGGRIYIENFNGNEKRTGGTSISAPMVTGTIALLMEEFPILKTNPALVKSIVHLGAEKLPSQTTYFDEQAGFGLINYQNMRKCMLGSKYCNFSVSTTASAGDVIASCEVSLPYLTQIKVNANSIVNSNSTAHTTTAITPEYTNYSIKIYDVMLSRYVAASTIDSNADYLEFTNNSALKSRFRIDIVLEEDNASGEAEMGAFAYELLCNNHSVGAYSYYNNRLHMKHCVCGEYVTETHYIRGTDVVDGRYATCLGCGAQLDLTKDYANTIMSLTAQVSINGSYILPSGIVVLVEEDIQAYLDGTLVFYNSNSVPDTQ